MSLGPFLFGYMLGGLTFVPLVALVLLTTLYIFATKPRSLRVDGDLETFREEDEKLLRRLTNSPDVATAHFTVTREWVPPGAAKSLERQGTSPCSEPTSVYQSMYKTFFDRKSSGTPTKDGDKNWAKRSNIGNFYYVVLRHGHLMLYDDEEQTEVRHVIALSLYHVDIYGGEVPVPEGELYIRRTAIRLVRRFGAAYTLLNQALAELPFYLYSENASQKEDFYLALVRSQEKLPDDSGAPPRPMWYRQQDIIALVHRLHSSEEHLQMNWVNGLLGRLFLSVYRTKEIEDFVRAKIAKKISRVNTPNMISDVKLEHLIVGQGLPYATNPRLKEMTVDGEFCVEMDIDYAGNARVELSAIAGVNLGAHLGQPRVNLELAVVLKRLTGHAFFRLKSPPSNRIWFTFESMPKLELAIEPIVGNRHIMWGPVVRLIETRMKDIMAETIVLPHWDDVPFTDTMNERVRGGIWTDVPRKVLKSNHQSDTLEKKIVDSVGNEAYELASSLNKMPRAEVCSAPEPERTASTPTLVHSVQGKLSGRRSASTIGLVDATETPRNLSKEAKANETKPPSIKSSSSGSSRELKQRSYTIAQAEPLVVTNVVNAHAVRGGGSKEDNPAASAVKAIRSRSSSGTQSDTIRTSSSPPRSNTMSVDIIDNSVNKCQSSEVDHDIRSGPLRKTTPTTSISDKSTKSFRSVKTFLADFGTASYDGTRTSEETLGKPMGGTAFNVATAAVKKWYAKTRKSSGNGSVNRNTNNDRKDTAFTSSRSSFTFPGPRRLPPAEILPPPVLTKSMDVSSKLQKLPKRKLVSPPALSACRRPTPPSSVLLRFQENDLLIVATPESDPSTPSSVLSEGKIKDEDEPAVADVAQVSTHNVVATPIAIDERPSRALIGSWEHNRMLELEKGECELRHAAEEAELRTSVAWGMEETNA